MGILFNYARPRYSSMGSNAVLVEAKHKVLFVNGGEDFKAWVMHGGDSPKKSERDAWLALKERNVSLFYCDSFSQEWVSDVSGKLIKLTTQNGELQLKVKGQGDKIVEQSVEIARTTQQLPRKTKAGFEIMTTKL
eukprot:gene30478-39725_t